METEKENVRNKIEELAGMFRSVAADDSAVEKVIEYIRNKEARDGDPEKLK